MRAVIATACFAALAVSATAAPVTDWKVVDKALNAIPSAAGISVGKRIATCKIIVHKDTTWIETAATDRPEYGAKKGDTILKLVFDMPQPARTSGPGPQPEGQKNVSALWVISGGKPNPLSAWAKALQDRPVPLGYDASTNC